MGRTDRLRIAIDGPAGAGKSTAARLLAERLHLAYVDTGAMYRALALKVLESGTDPEDGEALRRLLADTEVDYQEGHILLDGRPVDGEIRTDEVSRAASNLSRILAVREKLVFLQRAMGQRRDLVMDGRDIGSNVLTDAEYKFYLTAQARVRAERRAREYAARGLSVDVDQVEADIRLRDAQDAGREHNPLVAAEDAILIDNSALTIEETIDAMLAHIS